MTADTWMLMATAASIGFFHTLLGPDHYVPFVVMARAGQWSRTKSLWITVLCGLGHVLSSVVLGLIGLALGLAVLHLERFESIRGSVAGWMLIGFGLAYFLWGVHRATKGRGHKHFHTHDGGDAHVHAHGHSHEVAHEHDHGRTQPVSMTPWILFTIFVFGPCEPLIPLLMYPAARESWIGLAAVTLIFAVVTIGTMLAIVMASLAGISFLPLEKMERYTHAAAGAALLLCGVAIQFLGL